jgi:hypothetical protein
MVAAFLYNLVRSPGGRCTKTAVNLILEPRCLSNRPVYLLQADQVRGGVQQLSHDQFPPFQPTILPIS